MQGKIISLRGELISAIFHFHNLDELVAHFPARRAAIRVGRFAIPLRFVNLTIFARNPSRCSESLIFPSQVFRVVRATYCDRRPRKPEYLHVYLHIARPRGSHFRTRRRGNGHLEGMVT